MLVVMATGTLRNKGRLIPGTIRIAKLASAADDRLNDVIGVKVVSLAKQIQQQQQVQQNTATSHTCLEQYYSALIPITSI